MPALMSENVRTYFQVRPAGRKCMQMPRLPRQLLMLCKRQGELHDCCNRRFPLHGCRLLHVNP